MIKVWEHQISNGYNYSLDRFASFFSTLGPNNKDNDTVFQTCKESFVNGVRSLFIVNKNKFKQLNILVATLKENNEKQNWLINKFEEEILKLKNRSEFFTTNHENLIIFKPSRRWLRCPQTLHILLTLFRVASQVDTTKTLKENIENFYNLTALHSAFSHIFLAKPIFDELLIEDGFNKVFKESSSFEDNWKLESDKVWFGGSQHGIAYFNAIYANLKRKVDGYYVKQENIDNENKQVRNAQFCGFRKEFLDKYFPLLPEDRKDEKKEEKLTVAAKG